MFVQLKLAPFGEATKLGTKMLSPGHTSISLIGFSTGLGLTRMRSVSPLVEHPLIEDTIITSPSSVLPLVLLAALNGMICPLPEAAKPIAVLEFVQV